MDFVEIKEKLQWESKVAMRDKNEPIKAVISTVGAKINAAFKEAELKGKSFTTEDIQAVFAYELKQTNESKEGAIKAGRLADIEKANAQIEFLEKFLPKQLDEAGITEEVKAIISELGLTNPTKKEFGAIMKVVSPRLKGRADGKLVSKVVQGLLQ